jgi:hypothetical protein
MPQLLNNSAHWRLRAQELRLLAQQIEDTEAKAVILKMADEYDRLAVRAAERMNQTIWPVSAAEPMNNSEANATDVVVKQMFRTERRSD